MYEFMAWLEGSALGHAMRESGVWTYAVVNLVHILGVASLFGALLVLDLRLLGLWRRVPLSEIARPTVPVTTVGFLVAATSGICLITTNATDYVGNPFLFIKFPAIVLGLVNVAVLNLLPGLEGKKLEGIIVRRPVTADNRWWNIARLLADRACSRTPDRLLVDQRTSLYRFSVSIDRPHSLYKMPEITEVVRFLWRSKATMARYLFPEDSPHTRSACKARRR